VLSDSLRVMFSARYLYLLGRAGATFASLTLALVYSRDLGVVNRSSISVIMSTNALLWVVLTSGATLTIRKIGWKNAGNGVIRSFNSVIAGQFAVIILIYLVVINLYSQIKNPIALNLMILSLFYVTASGIHLILMELLISAQRFKSAGILEILTVVSQLTLYITGSHIYDLSTTARLLLAFSFSYLLVSTVALYLILETKKFTFGLSSPWEFLQRSRYNHVLGASLGFLDRIDRLLVGFLLAAPILGKYAVATSLITLLRFFPDGVSKLIMAKKVTLKRFIFIRRELVVISGILLSVFVISFSREVVYFWLGPDWVLGISIYAAIAMQELSRGLFQIVANQNILNDSARAVHRAAVLVPILAVLSAIIGLNLFGIIAVPGAFCASYLTGIVVMRRRYVS